MCIYRIFKFLHQKILGEPWVSSRSEKESEPTKEESQSTGLRHEPKPEKPKIGTYRITPQSPDSFYIDQYNFNWLHGISFWSYRHITDSRERAEEWIEEQIKEDKEKEKRAEELRIWKRDNPSYEYPIK